MKRTRGDVEDAIEQLIELLDAFDGDPDSEAEPFEEQHDAEAELTWTSGDIPPFYVIAERARRRSKA